MNRPIIVVMYGIAGVVSGYFSIYFLIEMKREYGDKFTRPRNRVSRYTQELMLSLDPGGADLDWRIVPVAAELLRLV